VPENRLWMAGVFVGDSNKASIIHPLVKDTVRFMGVTGAHSALIDARRVCAWRDFVPFKYLQPSWTISRKAWH
jgi:hypothetical protein